LELFDQNAPSKHAWAGPHRTPVRRHKPHEPTILPPCPSPQSVHQCKMSIVSAAPKGGGCGGVGEGNADGRGGERDGAANEEATAREGERTAAGAAGEPAGLDVEVVTPRGAYVPAGFGEGSLWATEPVPCNDGGSSPPTSSGGASSSSTIIMESSAQAACAMPDSMLLKRLDPRTGAKKTCPPEDYLRTSRAWTPCPSGSRKRNAGRSDSIRSIGFAEDHEFNIRWLKEACRILKPGGTIWVTGTHHIIFSLSFALQTMKLKLINVTWAKPDPPPNALHTALTHLKAVESAPVAGHGTEPTGLAGSPGPVRV
jgi:hypothetical protein